MSVFGSYFTFHFYFNFVLHIRFNRQFWEYLMRHLLQCIVHSHSLHHVCYSDSSRVIRPLCAVSESIYPCHCVVVICRPMWYSYHLPLLFVRHCCWDSNYCPTVDGAYWYFYRFFRLLLRRGVTGYRDCCCVSCCSVCLGYGNNIRCFCDFCSLAREIDSSGFCVPSYWLFVRGWIACGTFLASRCGCLLCRVFREDC